MIRIATILGHENSNMKYQSLTSNAARGWKVVLYIVRSKKGFALLVNVGLISPNELLSQSYSVRFA